MLAHHLAASLPDMVLAAALETAHIHCDAFPGVGTALVTTPRPEYPLAICWHLKNN